MLLSEKLMCCMIYFPFSGFKTFQMPCNRYLLLIFSQSYVIIHEKHFFYKLICVSLRFTLQVNTTLLNFIITFRWRWCLRRGLWIFNLKHQMRLKRQLEITNLLIYLMHNITGHCRWKKEMLICVNLRIYQKY